MRNSNVAAYLDAGSISVFAQQITEAVGGVATIALHELDGQLIWAGPDQESRDVWTSNPFLRADLSKDGYVEHLGTYSIFVFPLHLDDTAVATLSLRVEARRHQDFESIRGEIVPIIECIERQLGINCELSAVRRMSREAQKGVRLLMSMDELDGCGGAQEILHLVLEMAAEHFKADMTAIVLPKLGVQDTIPASLIESGETQRAVMSTLGSLLSGARLHRQVLLSDANLKTSTIAGLAGARPKILCAPVINTRDEVIGIFVLLSAQRFSREQVRLARAICAKITSLLRGTEQVEGARYSRHGLLSHASNVIRRSPTQPHAMIQLDIDKLHVVNDKFGHMAGDRVITAVGRIVDELCTASDAVSHLHGDNYAIFMRDANEQKAFDRASMILDAITKEPIDYDTENIQVTASAGIALIPDVVADASAALNTAEVASRSAKSRGGNRVVVFRDVDASVAQRRSDLDQVNHLQAALIEDRFELYAQRIQSLRDEENSYRYEILIRMRDVDGALLPPDRFLSAAERYQLMGAIDRWVVRHTLDMLGESDNLLEISLGSFSINLSAQSLADDSFMDFVEARITESGVPPDALIFEITETAVVRNIERAQRCIKRLRRLGCRIALDDFGTGYCSFAYLKDLPVQYIKVDGVFVRDILENPLSEAIVVSMTSIAGVMQAMTVAEHVESDLVMQRLRQHGIDFAQGFLVARPRPLVDVLDELGPAVVTGAESRSELA